MLLRSASTPILKPCSFRSSPEPDLGVRIRTTRPISMSLSPPIKKIPRTLSEDDLKCLHFSKKKILLNSPLTSQGLVEREEELEAEGEGKTCLQKDTSYCLHDGLVLDEGCGGAGAGNGGVYGGAGGGDGESGNRSESMEGYYQRMIKKFPGDSLVLANYAKFLKEVRSDLVKAEEYCERAILAKQDERDGNVLSLYGDLIWKNYKDAPRAQSYYDQAVKSAPGDCYVLASYAQFLWDAGEDDDLQVDDYKKCNTQPNLLPPLTAAS
ncbi:uncharacterized protein LOC116132381 [Pistacia vera]|uniref:uncharacterized protein LOC116132381 n=1 Tax=Pistacia vera TaxID=55513 RepID=UPI001262CD73|nr:uncharacterized protein LOC116132381 [Pistacia vera]